MFRDGGGAKQIRKPGKSQEEQEPVAFLLGWFWVWWLHLQHHRRLFNKNQKLLQVCLCGVGVLTQHPRLRTSSWSRDSPGTWKEDSTDQGRRHGLQSWFGNYDPACTEVWQKTNNNKKKTGSQSNPVIKCRWP